MRTFILCVVISMFIVFLPGCKKGESESTMASSTKSAQKGPDYSQFAALKKATFDVSLPFLEGPNVDNDEPCFVEAMGIEPMTADMTTQGLIDENMKDVSNAIMKWVLEEFDADAVSSTDVKNWKVSFDSLVSIQMEGEQLLFAENPQCLTNGGWLPDEHHLITTLFGTRTLRFESTVPLTEPMKISIQSTAAAKNITMTSGSMGDNSENPPPVTEWALSFEQPIYFGAREISDDMWRKESDKNDCDIIIITDDPSPRKPECPEFQESAFSVSIIDGEPKPVSVTITTGEKNQGVMLKWGGGTKLRLSDRIFLWLKVEKVEVGTNLKINSVVLNPAYMEGDGATSDDAPSTEDSYGEGAGDSYTAPAGSDNAVDGYLSN